MTAFWIRVVICAGLLGLLAYGCTDVSCERTRTCAGEGTSTAASANQPDAAVDDAEITSAEAGVCPAGKHECLGVCVDSDDPLTCGASCTPCDVPTDGTATCDGVRCGGGCEAGKKLCFGACIDTGAACERSCSEGTHECGGLCASDDSVNACGDSCDPCPVPVGASQATCSGGECGFVCTLGSHSCGTTCQRDTEPRACGANCEACEAIENGFPACNNRVCTVWCLPGFHVCTEGCVANDSPDSCGTSSCAPCTAPAGGNATCNDGICGTECPAGEKLCAGVCISVDAACSGVCPEGSHNCDQNCIPNDNAAQCGVDCVSCPVPVGATEAACIDGQCSITGCREAFGFHRCGDTCPLIDLPEACGPECVECPGDPTDTAATRTCQNDECGVVCSAGFHLCDDGCQTNTDVTACGADCIPCAEPAGGTVSCVNGACVTACPVGTRQCLGACLSTDVACDGSCPEDTHLCSNFCLSDTLVTSCGTRCTACPAPPDFGDAVCSAGVCGIACDPEFHPCGTDCAPNTDVNRCGDACEQCTVGDTRIERATCVGGACAPQCLGTVEVCDALELDNDCDGDPQGQGLCQCRPGAPGIAAEVSTCAAVYPTNSPVGVCATRGITCMADGQWPAFNTACVQQTSEVCDAGRLDENCNGTANENCLCTEGQTTTCALQYGSQGPCATRVLVCPASGMWPAPATACGAPAGSIDSCTVPGDDANCNGIPNENCLCSGVTCTASDQCHVAGVCSGNTGTCSNPTAPSGTLCSDGVACTQNDTCNTSGQCAGTPNCNPGEVCNPTNGLCVCDGATCTGCCSTTSRCITAQGANNCGLGGGNCASCTSPTPTCSAAGTCVCAEGTATCVPGETNLRLVCRGGAMVEEECPTPAYFCSNGTCVEPARTAGVIGCDPDTGLVCQGVDYCCFDVANAAGVCRAPGQVCPAVSASGVLECDGPSDCAGSEICCYSVQGSTRVATCQATCSNGVTFSAGITPLCSPEEPTCPNIENISDPSQPDPPLPALCSGQSVQLGLIPGGVGPFVYTCNPQITSVF